MPILISFIELMNERYKDFLYIFHSTLSQKDNVQEYLNKSKIKNFQVIIDKKIKDHLLEKSVFAISKSGTVSLEISNKKIPSIIIYKMNFLNYFLVKLLVKIKFANIINIAANKMIIPELIQSKCNSKEIFKTVVSYIEDPKKIKRQVEDTDNILDNFRTKNLPSELAAESLRKFISF